MHLVQIHQGRAKTVILLGDANRQDVLQEKRQFTAHVLLSPIELLKSTLAMIVLFVFLPCCLQFDSWFPTSASVCACGETRREDATREMFQPDSETCQCLPFWHCQTCVLCEKYSTYTTVSFISSTASTLGLNHKNSSSNYGVWIKL